MQRTTYAHELLARSVPRWPWTSPATTSVRMAPGTRAA